MAVLRQDAIHTRIGYLADFKAGRNFGESQGQRGLRFSVYYERFFAGAAAGRLFSFSWASAR